MVYSQDMFAVFIEDLMKKWIMTNNEAMRLLEQLTPGGSEFYNDPKRCYDFVSQRMASMHKISVKKSREAQNLRRLRVQVLAALEAAQEQVWHPSTPGDAYNCDPENCPAHLVEAAIEAIKKNAGGNNG